MFFFIVVRLSFTINWNINQKHTRCAHILHCFSARSIDINSLMMKIMSINVEGKESETKAALDESVELNGPSGQSQLAVG